MSMTSKRRIAKKFNTSFRDYIRTSYYWPGSSVLTYGFDPTITKKITGVDHQNRRTMRRRRANAKRLPRSAEHKRQRTPSANVSTPPTSEHVMEEMDISTDTSTESSRSVLTAETEHTTTTGSCTTQYTELSDSSPSTVISVTSDECENQFNDCDKPKFAYEKIKDEERYRCPFPGNPFNTHLLPETPLEDVLRQMCEESSTSNKRYSSEWGIDGGYPSIAETAYFYCHSIMTNSEKEEDDFNADISNVMNRRDNYETNNIPFETITSGSMYETNEASGIMLQEKHAVNADISEISGQIEVQQEDHNQAEMQNTYPINKSGTEIYRAADISVANPKTFETMEYSEQSEIHDRNNMINAVQHNIEPVVETVEDTTDISRHHQDIKKEPCDRKEPIKMELPDLGASDTNAETEHCAGCQCFSSTILKTEIYNSQEDDLMADVSNINKPDNPETNEDPRMSGHNTDNSNIQMEARTSMEHSEQSEIHDHDNMRNAVQHSIEPVVESIKDTTDISRQHQDIKKEPCGRKEPIKKELPDLGAPDIIAKTEHCAGCQCFSSTIVKTEMYDSQEDDLMADVSNINKPNNLETNTDPRMPGHNTNGSSIQMEARTSEMLDQIEGPQEDHNQPEIQNTYPIHKSGAEISRAADISVANPKTFETMEHSEQSEIHDRDNMRNAVQHNIEPVVETVKDTTDIFRHHQEIKKEPCDRKEPIKMELPDLGTSDINMETEHCAGCQCFSSTILKTEIYHSQDDDLMDDVSNINKPDNPETNEDPRMSGHNTDDSNIQIEARTSEMLDQIEGPQEDHNQPEIQNTYSFHKSGVEICRAADSSMANPRRFETMEHSEQSQIHDRDNMVNTVQYNIQPVVETVENTADIFSHHQDIRNEPCDQKELVNMELPDLEASDLNAETEHCQGSRCLSPIIIKTEIYISQEDYLMADVLNINKPDNPITSDDQRMSEHKTNDNNIQMDTRASEAMYDANEGSEITLQQKHPVNTDTLEMSDQIEEQLEDQIGKSRAEIYRVANISMGNLKTFETTEHSKQSEIHDRDNMVNAVQHNIQPVVETVEHTADISSHQQGINNEPCDQKELINIELPDLWASTLNAETEHGTGCRDLSPIIFKTEIYISQEDDLMADVSNINNPDSLETNDDQRMSEHSTDDSNIQTEARTSKTMYKANEESGIMLHQKHTVNTDISDMSYQIEGQQDDQISNSRAEIYKVANISVGNPKTFETMEHNIEPVVATIGHTANVSSHHQNIKNELRYKRKRIKADLPDLHVSDLKTEMYNTPGCRPKKLLKTESGAKFNSKQTCDTHINTSQQTHVRVRKMTDLLSDKFVDSFIRKT